MTNKPSIFDAVFSDGKFSSYRRLLQAMIDADLIPILYREYAAKPNINDILLIRHDVNSAIDAVISNLLLSIRRLIWRIK